MYSLINSYISSLVHPTILIMSSKDIIQEWVLAYNYGDAKAISSFYHQDAINHQVTANPIVGKDNIYKKYKEDFETIEMHRIIENIFEDGQWIIVEWRDLKGARGSGFFQIENNKIIMQRGYGDKLSFLKANELATTD